MTRSQAERYAINKAAQNERKGPAFRGAIGTVFESDTHFCVNVGWKVKGLK
ncbi:hypothetical protein phiP47_052 [Plesiomonas phage phiP4-7]|nr:hypothetical protein phiP47_052 [Plesiomonas phage phiP4-7]